MNQTITLTVEFKITHNPATEEHLLSIVKNYLRGKGVELEDKKIII